MSFLDRLCPPAKLYVLYVAVHTGLTLAFGKYSLAVLNVLGGLVGVYFLDSFCRVNLGVLSWVIIATPFVITALALSIALGLNLDHVITKFTIEKFTPLTADNSKNRDKYVTQLKGGEAPVPSNMI
jgi:hypothetical protein